MNMTRLLDFIEAADAVSLKQAFDDKAMEKVSSDLECMKVEVAQNYFNKPEVTTEEVVDEGKTGRFDTDFPGIKLVSKEKAKKLRDAELVAKKKMSPEEMD